MDVITFSKLFLLVKHQIDPNMVILSLSLFIFALMRLTTQIIILFARLQCPLVTIKSCVKFKVL